MTAFIFVAKNSLVAGHTAGTSYNLEPKLRAHLPVPVPIGVTQTSIDGTFEATIDRRDKFHDITIRIDESAIDNYTEFFDSVDAKETFTVDITGSIAVPVNAVSAQLMDLPRFSRVSSEAKYDISLRVKYV